MPPISLVARFATLAELAVAPPEEVCTILRELRAYQHAERASELQELAHTSSGLVPGPDRA